ncbi:TIM44-like domain-containing protein [Teichococcus oryzae]|uniref:Tim44 domain-containing protein n=1 Tax=Teichococcus oryzae TaxID=1608942 RepID=A0A5B2TG38_9PROT|nr:TIM44-like domain-containing protein [Pseudoroseomonas oryzae]KAA2213139.1 Tim44 domain-containing protein [Pseudoroseomonas oryzae]
MRRKASILAAFAAFALVLGPALAEARPGGRSSMGSRGSRTFTPPPVTRTAPDAARPMDRTLQQPARPGTAAPGMAPAQQSRGMFGGGFGGALMGGLIGMGIGGLLFGNGLFGGFGGFGSILGLLLQIVLIVFLVRMALRFFRNRQSQGAAARGMQRPAMAGGPNPHAMRRDMGAGGHAAPRGSSGTGPAAAPVQLNQSDFQAFEALLRDVNAAWSRRDLAGLGRLATPEMNNYFAQDMRDLDARGWRNETRDLKLEQGDLAEAWREGNAEFATVAMRFSLVDVTYDAQGNVVEGDPQRRDTAAELWTFVRQPAGAWKLSAIQQTR